MTFFFITNDFTRYVGEICFNLDTLKIVKSERIISLSDSEGKLSCDINFDDEALARLWEKYITFWLENSSSLQEEESIGLGPSRSVESG